MSNYDPKELKKIIVNLNPDKIQKEVIVHPNQKMYQLIKKIADAFKLKISEFYIRTKQGPLSDSNYDDQIKEFGISQLFIQRVLREDMEKEFPSYLIGNNLEYTTIFLELLQTGNEICKREVLSLLETLPINIEFKVIISDSLRKIASDASVSDWEKIFRWNGTDLSPTVYYLMSLEDLMIPKKDFAGLDASDQQNKLEFSLKFLQKGGFNFLFNMLCELSKNELEKDTLKTKILSTLTRIIQYIFYNKFFKD